MNIAEPCETGARARVQDRSFQRVMTFDVFWIHLWFEISWFNIKITTYSSGFWILSFTFCFLIWFVTWYPSNFFFFFLLFYWCLTLSYIFLKQITYLAIYWQNHFTAFFIFWLCRLVKTCFNKCIDRRYTMFSFNYYHSF